MVTHKRYNGRNLLSLYIAQLKLNSSDPRWATYNQVQDAGLKLRKGCRGVPIELFRYIDKRTNKEIDWEKFKAETESMNFETRRQFVRDNTYALLKSYTVFNGKDIEGIEPYVQPQMSAEEIAKRNERIEDILASSEAPINYDGNGMNYYTTSTDDIHLTSRESFKSTEQFYGTALHEQGHSTGHSSRLDRDLTGNNGSPSYAREELVAEFSSLFIAAELGLNPSDRLITNSGAYIKGWLNSIPEAERADAVLAAVREASAASDYLCKPERRKALIQDAQTMRSQEKEVAIKHNKPLMINFYAGPSCGKTTAALELTAALKKVGFNVEYASEYAKDLVHEGRTDELKNQQAVTDEQYHRFDRLRGSVDIIVTDSPVLLGLVYGELNGISKEYAEQIRGYYNSFDNFNMLMTRPKNASFQTEGRVHNEQQSIELDGKIKSMLEAQKVFYGTYKRDDIDKTVERITQTYHRLYGEKHKGKIPEKDNTPPPVFKPDEIPQELKDLSQWAAYQRLSKNDNGHYKKKLYNCNIPKSSDGYLEWAYCNDPKTWTTFDKAIDYKTKYGRHGVALALTPETKLTCIDLDECMQNGKMSELALSVLKFSNGTYAERSSSGQGIHVFVSGNVPKDFTKKSKDGQIEIYDCSRLMSMTGDKLEGAESVIKPPSDALMALLDSKLKIEHKENNYSNQSYTTATNVSCNDQELLERISKTVNADEFRRLMDGENMKGDNHLSDFRLCQILAFYSGGNAAQVERIFRQSGLFRDVNQKNVRYPERTARKAVEFCKGVFYNPSVASFNRPQRSNTPSRENSNGNAKNNSK